MLYLIAFFALFSAGTQAQDAVPKPSSSKPSSPRDSLRLSVPAVSMPLDSTRVTPDSLGSSADSLATAGDSLGVRIDSLGAVGDTVPGPGPGPGLTHLDLFPASLYSWDRDALSLNPDRRAREVLEWQSPLLFSNSGGHFTPDPMDYGELPGRQPVTVMQGGLPLAPPGMPETTPDAMVPGWAASAELAPPSLLYLPNNPTGGAILQWNLVRPDTTVAVSGVRLSDGSNDANSNELYFVRPSGVSTFWLLWSDHKTPGRTFFRRTEGQNLLLRYERPVGRALVTLTGQDHHDRVKLDLDRRWLWNRNSWDLRIQSSSASWDFDIASSVSWHRFAWEGEPGSLRRKSTLYQSIVRLVGPGTRTWRPRLTFQADFHRQRFWAPGRLAVDRRDIGLGLATGFAAASEWGHLEAAAGITSPGQGRAKLMATVAGERRVRDRWFAGGHIARTARTRLLPHYANHLYTYVGQGFVSPNVEDDPLLELLVDAELRMERRTPDSRLAWVGRFAQIDNAVSGDDGALSAFVPAGYEFIPESAFGQTLRVVSGRFEFERSLPWGFQVEGWGALRSSDPSWESQLWMTRWEGRGELAWRRLWFRDGLDLELFVRGQAAGKRATTTGLIDPRVRFDGGATGTVGNLYLFLVFLNLEGALQEASALENAFGVLPLRSYRLGLAWRFFD